VNDAGFVVAAWGGTAVVLAAYVIRIAVRTRRAERGLPDGDPER